MNETQLNVSSDNPPNIKPPPPPPPPRRQSSASTETNPPPSVSIPPLLPRRQSSTTQSTNTISETVSQSLTDDSATSPTPPPPPPPRRATITSSNPSSHIEITDKNSFIPPPPPHPPRRQSTTSTESSEKSQSSAMPISTPIPLPLPRRQSHTSPTPAKSSVLQQSTSEVSHSIQPQPSQPPQLPQRKSSITTPELQIGDKPQYIIRRPSLSPKRRDSNSIPSDNQEQVFIEIYKQGLMSKTNRDGKEDVYLFTLDNSSLSYEPPPLGITSSISTWIGRDDSGLILSSETSSRKRVIPLTTLIVREIDEENDKSQSQETNEMTGKKLGFRLLSKSKSFYLRCELASDRDVWYRLLDKLSKDSQMSTLGKCLNEEDMAVLKVASSKVSDCQSCGVEFGYFSRRHHCRNCGKCVCEACSREKVRILRIDSHALFKVCNECARVIKNNRKYGF